MLFLVANFELILYEIDLYHIIGIKENGFL